MNYMNGKINKNKVRKLNLYLCCLVALMLAVACENEKDILDVRHEAMTVNFSATKLAGDADGQSDASLNVINGYRFANGLLKEIYAGVKTDASGNGVIKLNEKEGSIYFIANASPNEEWMTGTTTLEEFTAEIVDGQEWGSDNLPMTGVLELDSVGTNVSVNMKRAVARLDVDALNYGVEVYDVTVSNLADRGFLWEQEEVVTPGTAQKNDWSKSFEVPLKNVKRTLLYMSEQKNSELNVEVNAAFGGGMHKLTASLPAQINRNTVYTLKISGQGGKVELNVVEDDWDEGVWSDAVENMKGLVDVDGSVLTDGVRVNERGDSVFVSHMNNVFKLALLAEDGAEVKVEGASEGTEISVEKAVTRSLKKVANVNVSSGFKVPGQLTGREYIHLKVYKDAVLKGNVVVVLEPNPLLLTGLIDIDRNGVCDFERYVDGEIGRITLPEGKRIAIEFDGGEDLWGKVAPVLAVGNQYKILAGWKPNDPKADGRTQQMYMVISNNDGTGVERYTIKRRNYGLPVVNMNGTWWCKYNLRGNVKNFEDQVSINDDMNVIGGDVRNYIETCADDEFKKLLGDQYQGGNVDGLKLTYEDGSFYYDGFASSATDLTNLAADAMTPDGYRLPTYDDFRFFTWNNDSNMGYGANAFNNGLGQRLSIYTDERNMMLGEVQYGPVMYTEFDYNGTKIVFCGLGHQWDATRGNIAKQNVIIATYGRVGSSWGIEGYPKSVNKGNWYKYGSQNPNKTRTIRCVKTNVEYIYD